MRLVRFAALAGIAGMLPAAAQVILQINPQQVSVTAQQPGPLNIKRFDNAATLTPIVPNYDQVMTAAGPWMVLQPIGADASTICSGQSICQVSNTTANNFQLRVYPERVPSGVGFGIIGIGGTGIQTNSVQGLLGSTSGTHTVTGSFTFTQTDVGPKTVFVSTTTGASPNYQLSQSAGSTWLTVSPPVGFISNSSSITAQVNPAGLQAGTYSATLTLLRPGTGATEATIPVTLTISGTGRVLTSSVQSVSLSPTVPTADVVIGVAPDLAVPHTIASSNSAVATAVLHANGEAGNLRNNSIIRITAPNPSVAGSATITITPNAATGYNPVSITVSVSGGGGGVGGRVLTANPASVNLTQFASTVNVAITPSTGEPVPYTMSLSGNLELLRGQGLFSVVGPSPNVPAAGGTYSFFANTAAIAAGTQGSVVFTPHPATGYQTMSIPVVINGSGSGGTGNLSISPSSLTFNVQGGTGDAVSQTVAVNSTDFFTIHSFQASATSSNNWLTVTPTFGTTPATLTVSVNPTLLTTAGTFQGNITITPFTGIGSGFPFNIPVTVNVTNPFTVSLNPSSLSLSAPTSGAAATSTVQLSLASGSGNPTFTTSVTTANGGNWLNVSTNSTTVPATLTITANPAGLSTGSTYSGTVNILSGTTTIASLPVSFTVQPAASLQVAPMTMTFTHQTTSTSNPPAQTAQITSTGASVGWSATATSAGNWLQVSPAVGSTPGAVTVSVVPTGLTAGTYNGQVSIASAGASNSPQTINVSLTVVTPAVPQVLSLLNAASSGPSVAVPGLIFTIRGTDLGPATAAEAVVSGGSIDTTLGGVRVLFDGVAAPLLYVSANQINGVMPFELYGRFSTRMWVEARNQRSRELELRVADSAPGIFTLNASGSGQGAILNQNGSVNGPSNPAGRGEIIVIYATGMGQTNPPSVTGRIAAQIASPLAIPTRVSIGGRDAEVLYAGPAPGLVAGAMQINVRVPEDAPTGTTSLGVQIGSGFSQSNVTVSIR